MTKKKKDTAQAPQLPADELLLKAGMTKQQIDIGRMRNTLEQMQRDMYIAQLVLVAGAGALKELYPDISPENLGKWGINTLKAAREEINKKAA